LSISCELNPLYKKLKDDYPSGAAVRVYLDKVSNRMVFDAVDALEKDVGVVLAGKYDDKTWLSNAFFYRISDGARNLVKVYLQDEQVKPSIESVFNPPEYLLRGYSLQENDFYFKVQDVIVRPMSPTGGIHFGGIDLYWEFWLPAFTSLRDPESYFLMSEFYLPARHVE